MNIAEFEENLKNEKIKNKNLLISLTDSFYNFYKQKKPSNHINNKR